jgi:NAD+ synthase
MVYTGGEKRNNFPMTVILPLPADARSALAIVDMQEFFFQKPERRKDLDLVVGNINRLIGFFESQHLPVVHVITCYQANGSDWDLKMKISAVPELIEGSPETAILPKIRVSPDHLLVRKTRYSAFFKTDLAALLKARAIQRLLVTGGYTHYCVNATIFDAYACDFIPGIITNAVISNLPDTALLIARMKRNGYHVFRTGGYIKGHNTILKRRIT